MNPFYGSPSLARIRMRNAIGTFALAFCIGFCFCIVLLGIGLR